jgi:hypothetical protein
MIDWFKEKFSRPTYPTWNDVPDHNADLKKVGEDMNKVIQFPEFETKTKEAAKDTGGKTVYSIGLTDNNRVSIVMGYSSMTMNSVGIQQLIDQLTLFKSQIEGNEDAE